jgi:hypothetical protein
MGLFLLLKVHCSISVPTVHLSHVTVSFQARSKYPTREQLQYMAEQQQQQQQQFKLLQQQAEQQQMRHLRKLQQQKLYQQQLQQQQQQYPLHRYGDPKEPGAGRYGDPQEAGAGQYGDPQDAGAGQYRGLHSPNDFDYESGQQLTPTYDDDATSPEAGEFGADYNGAGPDDDDLEADDDIRQPPANGQGTPVREYGQNYLRQLPPAANDGGDYEESGLTGGKSQYLSGQPAKTDPYRLTYQQQQRQQQQQQRQQQQQLGLSVYNDMRDSGDYSETSEEGEETFGEFR